LYVIGLAGGTINVTIFLQMFPIILVILSLRGAEGSQNNSRAAYMEFPADIANTSSKLDYRKDVPVSK
jgi:hypothetical protein